MASLIPSAEFVPLDSANHVILEDEPAWQQLKTELRRFLPGPGAAPRARPASACVATRWRRSKVPQRRGPRGTLAS